ncbi:unnamed protein product [Sphagnum balticum]
MREKARENIVIEQAKQKKSYDAKRAPPAYKEGDQGLVYNARNAARKEDKMKNPYDGPFTIKSVNENRNFVTLNKRAKCVSLIHLRPYKASKESSTTDEKSLVSVPNIKQKPKQLRKTDEQSLVSVSNIEHQQTRTSRKRKPLDDEAIINITRKLGLFRSLDSVARKEILRTAWVDCCAQIRTK